jgi:hypothetical protein
MRNATVLSAAIAALLMLGAPAKRATAMTLAPRSEFAPIGANAEVIHMARFGCRCERLWPRRRYWRWGHDGVWDEQLEERWNDPLAHFWGTPEPPLVPADYWARKWHPPWHRAWHRHWR